MKIRHTAKTSGAAEAPSSIPSSGGRTLTQKSIFRQNYKKNYQGAYSGLLLKLPPIAARRRPQAEMSAECVQNEAEAERRVTGGAEEEEAGGSAVAA